MKLLSNQKIISFYDSSQLMRRIPLYENDIKLINVNKYDIISNENKPEIKVEDFNNANAKIIRPNKNIVGVIVETKNNKELKVQVDNNTNQSTINVNNINNEIDSERQREVERQQINDSRESNSARQRDNLDAQNQSESVSELQGQTTGQEVAQPNIDNESTNVSNTTNRDEMLGSRIDTFV